MNANQLTPDVGGVDIGSAVAAFLSGKSPVTIAAYRRDLLDFARHEGVQTIDAVAAKILGSTHGHANLAVLRYRAGLLNAKLSPATINRRLTALRSLVTLARTLGIVAWELEVDGVALQQYRDTRGPGVGGLRALLKMSNTQRPEKAKRDAAIIMLLFGLALRRAEVASLDLVHWNHGAGTLAVLGKGHLDRVVMTVPGTVREALVAWVAVRGAAPGPLFGSFDRAGKGDGRLKGDGIFRIVRALGRRAGVVARPHGLRLSDDN